MPVQQRMERILRHLPMIVAAATSIALFVAAWDVDTTQRKLTDLSGARLIETEHKRANEISAAIKDLQNNVENLISAPEIENYFINFDLGMSLQYGLGASLDFARNFFLEKAAEAPSSGSLPISQLSLFDENGQIIVSSSKDASTLPLPSHPSVTGVRIDFPKGVVEVTEDYYMRGLKRGTVIATVEIDQLSSLTNETRETEAEFAFLVFEKTKVIKPVKDTSVSDAALHAVLAVVSEDDEVITTALPENGPFSGFFALNTPIPDLPFSLLSLKPKNQALFLWSFNYSGLVLAILAVVILVATAIVTRMGFYTQRLKHAIETTTRHQAVLHQKNKELSDEIQRREHAEAQLRNNQSELRMLSQVALKAHDGVMIADFNHKVVWTNEAFERNLGQVLDKSQREYIGTFLAPTDATSTAESLCSDKTHRGEGCRGVIERNGADGQPIALDVTLFPIMDEAGNKEFFVYIARDVTVERKTAKAMDEAREAAEQGERTKAEFLANMSHEIRTPLSGVIGMADLLVETDLDREQRSFAETIRGSSTSLLAIINDILDLSKMDAGKMVFHPVDFSPSNCFAETLDLLAPMARSKGLDLSLISSDNLPILVRADDGRIRQVATNIIGNAIKFTETGKVLVHLSSADIDGRACIKFKVSDTGVGIAKEKLAMIFEHFTQAETSTTRRFGGTGLGLSICRHIVHAMGGHIDVTSQIGCGTVFSVVIPVESPSASMQAQPQNGMVADRDFTLKPGLSVLVAEDNQTNQLVLRKYLKSQPIDVAFADDGVEAVSAASTGMYDLIFMDMSMPRMNGVEATRQIRTLPIRQPAIVALTAHALDSEKRSCIDAGMDDFLTKPIRKKAFIRWISNFQAKQTFAQTEPVMVKNVSSGTLAI